MKWPQELRDLRVVFRLVVVVTILVGVLFSAALYSRPQLGEPYMIYCGTVNNVAYRAETRYDSLFAIAQPGYALFESNCKACHRIGFTLVGPPLRYSYSSRDSVWLRKMIVDGMALVREGDTLATRQYTEFQNIQHTNFTGFTEYQVTALMDYLKWESEQEVIDVLQGSNVSKKMNVREETKMDRPKVFR